ncbi:hypothetical protein GEMRC1_007695 [Eukaryota sp. GEM-RC1]
MAQLNHIHYHTSYDDFSANYTNLYSFLSTVAKKFPENDAVGTRQTNADGSFGDYVWRSYSSFMKRVNKASRMLKSLLPVGSRIALLGLNCEEFTTLDLACMAAGMVTVNIYASLRPEDLNVVVQDAEISACIIGNLGIPAERKPTSIPKDDYSPEYSYAALACGEGILAKERAATIFDGLSGDKLVVTVGINQTKPESLFDHVLKIRAFEEFVHNDVDDSQLEPPTFEEICAFDSRYQELDSPLCTIVYTSGSSGSPKGCMITHRNLLSALGSFNHLLPVLPNSYLRYFHTALSFLPVSHILARLHEYWCFSQSGRLAFFSQDLTRLVDDIQHCNPTLLCLVPRVLAKLKDKIYSAVESGSSLKKSIFHRAYNVKLQKLRASRTVTHWLWDSLVFNKVARLLGNRLLVIISGSSPLDSDLAEFCQIAFKSFIGEGYGLSETTSCATCNRVPCSEYGQVGPALAGVEIKLRDIPDLSFYAKDGVGEVLVRSKCVSPGYWKSPGTLNIDNEGFLASGDIGTFMGDKLKLIDRVSSTFKLQQGEFINPELIETVIKRSPLISECFITGDGRYPVLAAFVVPSEDAWEGHRSGTLCEFSSSDRDAIESQSDAESCTRPDMELETAEVIVNLQECSERKVSIESQRLYWSDLLLSMAVEINRVCRAAELRSFEIPKHVYICNYSFAPDNGLTTPTFKLKRKSLKQHFKTEFEQLMKTKPLQISFS